MKVKSGDGRKFEAIPGQRLMRKFLASSIAIAVRRLRRSDRSTQDWGAGRPNAERVRAAYRCVLDRAAEPEGLAHWVGLLDCGGSFDELLRSFVRSSEFERRLVSQGSSGPAAVRQPGVFEVRAAYRCLLGREADPEGQAHWLAFLRSRGSLQEMLIGLMRSPEFARRLDEPPSDEAKIATFSVDEVLVPVDQMLTNESTLVAPGSAVVAAVGGPPPGKAQVSSAPGVEVVVPVEPLTSEVQISTAADGTFVEPMNGSPTPGAQLAAARAAENVKSAVAPLGVVARWHNKYAVIGNCQTAAMMRCLQALTGFKMPTLHWSHPDLLVSTDAARAGIVDLFGQNEKVFIQPAYWDVLSKLHPEFEDRVILYPAVAFAAYHPDVVYVRHKVTGEHVMGPCRDYQSSIAFLGWKTGLSVDQTLALFNSDSFRKLGFFESWEPSRAALLEEGEAAGIELGELLESWRRRGSFMRSMNHPSLFVSLDIARVLLEKHGIPIVRFDLEPYIYDWQSVGAIWPVYPEIGERLGAAGHYLFKLESPELQADQPLRTLSLKEYLDESFAAFSRYKEPELVCDRMQTGRYQKMSSELLGARADRVVSVKAPAGRGQAVVEPSYVPPTVKLKFAVLGNFQAGGMARCLQALLGGPIPREEYVTAERCADWESGRSSLVPLFSAYDKVFMQPWIWKALAERYSQFESKVVLYPSIAFTAYHPDLVDVHFRDSGAAVADGPMGKCHSSLAFLAWTAGLSVAETVGLFRRDVLQQLGHFDFWRSSERALLEEGRAAGLSLEPLLARWKTQGCFMHLPVHPKLFVIADIARTLLERLAIPSLPFDLADFAHDHLADDVAWPVYPGLGEILGCPESYEFKLRLLGAIDFSEVNVLGLEAFVKQSFAVYAEYPPDELACRRLAWPTYVDLSEQLKKSRTLPVQSLTSDSGETPLQIVRAEASNGDAPRPAHPYSGLPDHRFWRKAIQNVKSAQVDPVVSTKFKIGPDTKVATAGSCFALNISRRLIARGYNFLQAEPGPEGTKAAVEGVGGMGLFSARFGYLYTARQLRQLMERAYGRFAPDDCAWTLETGRFVDPFRPRVEIDGFSSVAALERSRADHLAAVRRMFESLDVFVFTLGLTEAWRARRDGAVFSVAPGVAGGQMDFERYEFVNFTVAEVDADLQAFIEELQHVNPRARLILTVSPVPIIATYADRHVLVSSTYTKSVLRVAAEQIARRNACCDYFPGYELVNGSFHRGSYIAEDLRTVTPQGVDHVMRLFFLHYAGDGVTAELNTETPALDAEMLAEARKNIRVVCDEELLEAAVR